jgi:hypothetical protein
VPLILRPSARGDETVAAVVLLAGADNKLRVVRQVKIDPRSESQCAGEIPAAPA